ncbi:hypothetical protein [Desmospora activa]|uniref:hypothetical protein n=1 Tax=Desmospora activa TaxID=500615 RepID=UPI000D3277F3|nr:hypothetical protein [Desmospora activa]
MSTFKLKILSFTIALALFFCHYYMDGDGQVEAYHEVDQRKAVKETMDTVKKVARTLFDHRG